MNVSQLMLATLRDTPSDAEIVSHQLLIRGGYIRRVGAGIYAYLPLMWRVLKKINAIVREEMDSTGALETLLPQLQPAELWKKSGRWQGYTEGEGIMFHLEDRQGKDLGLGPTHEEVITSVASDIVNSYRQLPLTLYQIQSKFRDEIRPRFGLMRGREFIMKDAYSFHANEKSLHEEYKSMDQAYRKIFKRCGLEALVVDADSGAIGGSASQEFMIASGAGEDLILTSPDNQYSANQEKAVSLPAQAIPLTFQEPSVIETPGQSTIEELCSANGFAPSQIVKSIAMLARMQDGSNQPLLLCLRGDHELNEVKLVNAITLYTGKSVNQIIKISPEQIEAQGLLPFPFGYIGPDLDDDVLKGAHSWNNNFLRIVDNSASSLEIFICGANQNEKHLKGASWQRLKGVIKSLDIRKAQAGDRCLHDPNQTLQERRGIEVGHIFQLGQKYSQALGASFTNEKGLQEAFWMGCYGIGISRLAQAAIEQHHDDAGMIWPSSIAPFEAIVVIANMKDEGQKKLGQKLYRQLKEAGIDALIDDRDERAGVKFKDSDLIGIPWRIVAGRDSAEGKVELFERSSRQTEKMSTKDAISRLISEIAKTKPID